LKISRIYEILYSAAFIVSAILKPSICYFLIGTVASICGTRLWFIIKNIKYKGVQAIGKIFSYEDDQNDQIPIIEFKPDSGETIREKPSDYVFIYSSKFGTNRRLVNTEVNILYDPDNPKKFIIDNKKGIKYTVPIIFISAGLVCIGFGVLFLLQESGFRITW